MEHTFLKKAKEIMEERRKRARLRQAVTAMMVLVAFSTSYLLMMPAITMVERTATCGTEAHEHDGSCYETLLVCSDVSKPGHSHSDSCYPEIYTCGESESEGHSHSDSCWSVTCGQNEGAGHSHSDSCYGNTCGESESEGHSHSDGCYTESSSLTCGESESAGHSHGDGCYGEDGSLACSESESAGHSHSGSCYTTSSELTCGESESAGHTHSASCTGLTCGEGEYEAHTHSDSCISMTCGKSESTGHTHTDSCKTRATAPACGLEECEAVETDHIHGTECYETRLVCKKAEHSHTDDCYQEVSDEDPSNEGPSDKDPSDEDLTDQAPADKVPSDEVVGDEVVGELPEEIIPELPTNIILSNDVLEQILDLDLDIMDDLELPETPDYSDALVVDQTVSKDENGIYTLTLEAFAKGELAPTAEIRPMDLVLVLDQSLDLYQPAQGAADLAITADDSAMDNDQAEEAAETWGLINRDTFLWLQNNEQAMEKAQLKGYFLAQSAGTTDSTGAWYLLQYLPEEGWLAEELADEGETIAAETIRELPDHIARFYVSQLGKQYDAISALTKLLAVSETDHRMAVVGYAGTESEGTMVLTGGETEEISEDALLPVLYEGRVELAEALLNISADHSGSSLATGLAMAEQILANTDNTADRDRMVVLMVGSQPDQDLNGAEDAGWAAMDAINTANTIKNVHNASIYTVASSNVDEDLMACVSSKYPTASVELVVEEDEDSEPELVTTTGEEAEGEFCQTVYWLDDLNDAILALGQKVASNTKQLDGTAVLSAVLADYFQLFQADAEDLEAPQIKVYTADHLGGNVFAENWVELAEASVELVVSQEEEDRIRSIDVSNFNFAEEILSEADVLTGAAAGGRKLIVQIPVEVRKGFWGGNNVPVSSEETGIYTGQSNVMESPIPEVNVEMSLELDAGTATVFYGQSVGMDDLVGTLTVGGAEVIVDDDGAFIPQADWMDDYAELTWLETPGEIDSTENSTGHTISVNLSPLYEGKGAQGAPVGMGYATEAMTLALLDEEQEAAEVPMLFASLPPVETIVGLNASDVVDVQVMAPVITFKDVVVSLGNDPDFTTTHDPVSNVSWVSVDGGITIEAGRNTPTLSYEYAALVQEDVYLLDTPMNVTVFCDGKDITNIASCSDTFCEFDLHDEDECILGHKLSLDETPEFWVHVQSGIRLPETGGMGTKIFYGLGGLLVVGAVVLLVTKKRMNDNEDEDDEDDL